MDGTNFWGTGNFAGTSAELDGTLFYGADTLNLQEVQNYLQAAGEARIIGGSLLVATKAATGVASGLYDFVDPASGNVVPLPWDADVANPYFNFTFTNLYLNWGSQFQTVLNFDMDPARTVVYGADQTYGIVKFNNIGGTWVQAPYFFGATNIGTLAQAAANQGCFGVCVDFSGPNPVIYATTMENGGTTNVPGGYGMNTTAGHQNNNRLIMIVDTGVSPGTNMVATTLAVAQTTNEFFGGVDFTPDLRPLITSQPQSYATVSGSTVPFTVTANSVYTLSYQWLQNSTNLVNQTNSTLTLSGLDTTYNNFTYQCVVTNYYGSVTSSVATLTVTATPIPPTNTTSLHIASGFISGSVSFPAVTATGTEPFTYQWYFNGTALSDNTPNVSGSGYVGSQSSSLAVTNLQLTDSGTYYVVISNGAGYASNAVDSLTVNYHLPVINAGQPANAATLLNIPATLTALQTGGTPPITNQWYQATLNTNGVITSSVKLSDTGDFSGSGTSTLTVTPSTLLDGTNYYVVVSNGGGSVTSSVASLTVITAPAPSQVSYTNQLYIQNFDSLPDPGTLGIAKNGTSTGNGASVNSINNPKDNGQINGVTYSLNNPFDFAFPVLPTSYVGGLGNSSMPGWYGAADTNLADAVDGITRFGAQNGDQSTGGDIDFGLNDNEGGIVGTNRALGLISTSTTGSTAMGLKLVNTSGVTLSNLNVSFIGELWRNNTGTRVMNFSYAVDPTANSFVLQSQPLATNTTPLDLPNAITVPNMAFSFPTNPLGTTIVDGTQSINRTNISTNGMVLSTPWTPGSALWLVWSINFYNQGGGQGYAIDNLSVYGTVYPPAAPVATTGNATKVTSTTATLNASVNPSNAPTSYWFQYGTTVSYGSSTATTLLGTVTGSSSVTAALTGLKQLTQYHFRFIASNSVNVVTGLDNTLTTLTNPVVTLPFASAVTATAGTLNATVNPNNGQTTNWFSFGSTTNYGTMVGSNVLASSLGFVPVAGNVSGLTPGQIYHFKITAVSAAGTVNSADATLTNLSISVPQVAPIGFGANGFSLVFTNATGASFSILSTNNLTIPRTNWPVIGHATESPAGSGNYYFTNAASAGGIMYYIIRQP
jgi:hypothetical protein